MTYGIHYSKYLTVLKVYNYASWITNTVDCKGTSDYIFTLGGVAIA